MSSAAAQLPPAVPWVECPTIRLDLGKPHKVRYADVPCAAIELAQVLLQALRNELPPKLRRLAPLIRLRTLNRFHREIVSLARIVGADWRDAMLANVSYELVLAAFGCSTVALSTPSGPVLARNMDWWPEEHVIMRPRTRQIRLLVPRRLLSAGGPDCPNPGQAE